MANNLKANNEAKITLAGAQALVENVKENMKLVSQGYLAIAPDVAKLYDCKGHKALGYKNFDEMVTMEFGMSHGTSAGIRKVFQRYGVVGADNKYSIPEKYKEFGYTKLLLFATDASKFEDAGINPIEAFTPEQTMKEMREALKLKLEEKAKEQDENAIDIESTEQEQGAPESTEQEQGAPESTEQEQESTEQERNEYSDKDNIEYMINVAKEVQGKMNYLKPEKAILWDAVIANLKELKKLAK